MAKAQCYRCGKTVSTGNKVSHSNRKTRRTWGANLQRSKIKIGGRVMTVRLCSRCIKSNAVAKA